MKLAISFFKKRALFIARNEVCEGYVFIGVCLSTGWGKVCMGEGVGQTPPQSDTMGYGQLAGGTHPTGIHSCWCY